MTCTGAPPSIYAAFGDERRLFLEAVRVYSDKGASSAHIILEAATARTAAKDPLEAAARGFTRADTPPGCLMASVPITGPAESLHM